MQKKNKKKIFILNYQNQFDDEFITELNNELHLSPYFSSQYISQNHSKFYELSQTKRKQSESPKRPSRKTFGGFDESTFSQNIKSHRRGKLFYESCQRGSNDDIKLLAKYLYDYPKKFLRSTKDPEHLINKKFLGQTPLYVACKNGNLSVVKFLLQNEAQIDIPAVFTTGKKVFQETALEVAVRWGHKLIIKELMLKGCQDTCIKKAVKQAQSKEIKDFIQSLIK